MHSVHVECNYCVDIVEREEENDLFCISAVAKVKGRHLRRNRFPARLIFISCFNRLNTIKQGSQTPGPRATLRPHAIRNKMLIQSNTPPLWLVWSFSDMAGATVPPPGYFEFETPAIKCVPLSLNPEHMLTY